MTTIVFISDLHSGSVYGLTPPAYSKKYPHHQSIQREGWDAYMEMVHKWKAPDILIVNGDCIDGSQKIQGGADLITSDRNVQSEMAVYALEQWRAKQIFMTYGSRYHVGDGAEDFEYNIAKDLGATIEGRLYLSIEGKCFDIRHKVGSSTIPHGRATPLLKEMAWDMIKEAEDTGPHIDVIVRSHVHYYMYIESEGKVMFTTPALQLSRGRYGSRECTGSTHWGGVRLTLEKGQIIGKDVNLCSLRANRAKVLKVA